MLVMKIFKDKVRFEWSDGEVESVVTLTSEDSEESAMRKLKRVIALVEGEQERSAPAPSPYRQPKYPALEALPPQTGNGWAAVYGPPELPEDRKGDWELVQPGEGE